MKLFTTLVGTDSRGLEAILARHAGSRFFKVGVENHPAYWVAHIYFDREAAQRAA